VVAHEAPFDVMRTKCRALWNTRREGCLRHRKRRILFVRREITFSGQNPSAATDRWRSVRGQCPRRYLSRRRRCAARGLRCDNCAGRRSSKLACAVAIHCCSRPSCLLISAAVSYSETALGIKRWTNRFSEPIEGVELVYLYLV